MRTRLYCRDFIDSGVPNECCVSCHDDEELGYEMIFIDEADFPEADAYVCCGISREIDALDEPLTIILSRALEARRQRENYDE